jgi:hypothetical protein
MTEDIAIVRFDPGNLYRDYFVQNTGKEAKHG